MVAKTLKQPDRNRLREVLDYNPITGKFVWKVKTGARTVVGSEAGCIDHYGYMKISLDGVVYSAHYLAWLYVHNKWPDKVKHRNGNRSDNRMDNLFVLTKDPVLGYKQGPELTLSRLRETLHYDPDTGVFIWKFATSSRNPAGSVAGVVMQNGYRLITLDGKKHLAHRLAWFYVNGVFPKNDLDHINRDRLDNRISNLRPATRAQNMANGNIRSDNSTGVPNVSPYADGRYRVSIQKNGKPIHVTCCDTIEEAEAAAKSASREIHGEFSKH